MNQQLPWEFAEIPNENFHIFSFCCKKKCGEEVHENGLCWFFFGFFLTRLSMASSPDNGPPIDFFLFHIRAAFPVNYLDLAAPLIQFSYHDLTKTNQLGQPKGTQIGDSGESGETPVCRLDSIDLLPSLEVCWIKRPFSLHFFSHSSKISHWEAVLNRRNFLVMNDCRPIVQKWHENLQLSQDLDWSPARLGPVRPETFIN